jgi:hypothetical protein
MIPSAPSSTYGPLPEPGSEEFAEASKKKRMDDAGKNPGKRARTLEKKKVETVKATMPQGKAFTP